MQLLLARASLTPDSSATFGDDFESIVGGEETVADHARRLNSTAEGVLVLDLGEGKGVLIDAAHIQPWTSDASGELPIEDIRATAAAWRKERRQTEWRLRLAEGVIGYSDALGCATDMAAVADAVTTHIPRIVESLGAALLIEQSGGTVGTVAPHPLLPDGFSLTMGKPLRAGGVFHSDEVPPSHPLHPLFQITGVASILTAPVGGMGLLVVLERRRDRIFEPQEVAVIRTLVTQAASILQRINLFSDIRELSLTDPLTGLANRRQLELVLQRGIAAARRGEPLSLILVDLDYFKEINDRAGHTAGDRVLCEFADDLRTVARASDVVVRYGGDEFLIVLLNGTAAGATSLVRRLRRRSRSVTFSVGIAEYDVNTHSAEHLIDAADRALYDAKRRRPAPPSL